MKRTLIEARDILQAAKMHTIIGEIAAKILMNLLQLDKLNRIYSEIGNIEGLILLKLIIQRRPDYKMMGNFLLQPLRTFHS